jgi:hypothetical protein
METIELLIQEYGAAGNRLAKGLEKEELPSLRFALQQRLGKTEGDLDLSPESLKRLEIFLHEYQQQLLHLYEFDKDELLKLAREIAAYLCSVLIIHCGAELLSTDQLWSSNIQVQVKGKNKKAGNLEKPVVKFYNLGNIAGAALDGISIGQTPRLYQVYSASKSKLRKQKL